RTRLSFKSYCTFNPRAWLDCLTPCSSASFCYSPFPLFFPPPSSFFSLPLPSFPSPFFSPPFSPLSSFFFFLPFFFSPLSFLSSPSSPPLPSFFLSSPFSFPLPFPFPFLLPPF
ncbi:hypothetical protein ACXWRS_09495, partial [Streptococcus pyogenes]